MIYRSLEHNSVTNAIFNFQSQVGAIPVFSCKSLIIRRHIVFLVWFIKRAWAACGLDAMFVGILMRDPARDFGVEFESLRHREIFEINARADKKL